jgi:glycosyltransferase involved in cell wall biosynthesis
MRITLFHNSYRIRGGEEQTVDFESRLLAGAGHDVHRHELSNERTFARPRLAAAVSAWKAAWNRSSYHAVREILKTVRPDVSHVHNWFPLLSPSIYAAHRDLGIPVVQSLHNYRLGCAAGTLLRDGQVCEQCISGDTRAAVRHRCYRGSATQTRVWCRVMGRGWSEGTFASMVDAYIAPSEVVRRKHVEMGLPADLIHVLPHACDDPLRSRPGGALRSRRDRSAGAVYVGRLVPEKGVDTLVQAWRGVDAPLRVIGRGPEESRLRAMASDLPHVEFLGEQPHDVVMRELQRTALLVFPSRWNEPFGLGIIEAMACGTPVLATRMGAAPELVKDGVTGVLIDPHDPVAMRRAASGLLSRDEDRERMGINARRRYLRCFTPDRHLESLEDLFSSLCGSGPVGARPRLRAAAIETTPELRTATCSWLMPGVHRTGAGEPAPTLASSG